MIPAVAPPVDSDPATSANWFVTEVQPHRPALRAWLLARFPTLPDVDDLVQETFARFLRARDASPIRSTRALLFATARNLALDAVRYTHSFLTDQTAPSPQFPAGTGIDGSRINSDLVWDMQVGRTFAYGADSRGWRRWLNGTQWTLGLMNVFDRLPPWHSTGYYSRFSDPRGRYVYLQTKKSL